MALLKPGANIAQPDVTIVLDLQGVIRDISLSSAISGGSVASLIGRPWKETVAQLGSDKVTLMIDDAVACGVSGFRQVTQRFPSGLELPIEYSAIRLGGSEGLIAIGRNLQAVAELQSRLIAAQQAREQDYWKLREVEARCRLLFDTSNDPVLLLKSDNSTVVEANPAAMRALGLAPGWEFLTEVAAADRDAYLVMLQRVREQGRTPGIVLHLGREGKSWIARASLVASDPEAAFLLQLVPVAVQQAAAPAATDAMSVDSLVERLPDAFAVIDKDGIIKRVNRAFLDLVQVSVEGAVLGERLGRWLARPGADLTVLLANVGRHKFVRLFSTVINGELGSNVEVEISAVGNVDSNPRYVGLLLRDVSRRLPLSDSFPPPTDFIGDQIGKTSLQKLVRDTVTVVERRFVETALAMANGNRTAAAELLGLSRQSLYAKLNKYGIEGDLHGTGRTRQ